ncbi:hypothetical protein B0I35DRAFT_433957 [Stachybotrys elegans]|uniref:Uncharacterized protein n=1 Tax=Stachybotrys elegans TaxID=80388 RepID=A0A8K0WR31_9HYPO|nr:hypothetical protein B0I35DRAFT_433957 [Stachybotrys elegans]
MYLDKELSHFPRVISPCAQTQPPLSQQTLPDKEAMALQARALISSWTTTPIPNLSLSAGALLALADLQTIAQRTVLTGGSSWLDALVLAPGLHYQQAADALDRSLDAALPSAVDESARPPSSSRYPVRNAAMVGYLRRVCAEDPADPVTLDVMLDQAGAALRGFFARDPADVDWLSHLLYLASPLLTAGALALMVLLEDWWALGSLLALILSRVFNIFIIKRRSRLPTPPQPQPGSEGEDTIAEYAVDLGQGRHVRLRGRPADIRAMTTQAWLRTKTHVEGFFEAGAKLIVYLVAALSGNLTQAGALVLMALLLVSAGLLGLSNAHLKGFRMNGRVARLEKMPSAKMEPREGEKRVVSTRVTV